MKLNEARIYNGCIYTMGRDDEGVYYNIMVPALNKEATFSTIKEAKEMIDYYMKDVAKVKEAISVLERHGFQVSRPVDKILGLEL